MFSVDARNNSDPTDEISRGDTLCGILIEVSISLLVLNKNTVLHCVTHSNNILRFYICYSSRRIETVFKNSTAMSIQLHSDNNFSLTIGHAYFLQIRFKQNFLKGCPIRTFGLVTFPLEIYSLHIPFLLQRSKLCGLSLMKIRICWFLEDSAENFNSCCITDVPFIYQAVFTVS